ncbi:MAG: pyridoxamine 5'-phosphate oxidase family protein [Alcanivoracaceae bacterium]|nr:pyridoxamine 5'-phosphate oxidase family protein [Alcanivoracaceae bacterium]
MGQKYLHLSEKLIDFIQQQQMFFVGTADVDGKVNISPKGLDTLKVVNKKQVVWLNLTGSGNETSAHIQSLPRMTLMFTAFVGNPMILRLYGKAKVVHKGNDEWRHLYGLFDDYIGARQVFVLEIELVQISCGMAVPILDYKHQREQLLKSAQRKGEKGIESYWQEKNQWSIDGKPTHIVAKNMVHNEN